MAAGDTATAGTPGKSGSNDAITTNTEINSIDTVGSVFLGIGFLILLLAYMRAQGRNRKLAAKLAKLEAKA